MDLAYYLAWLAQNGGGVPPGGWAGPNGPTVRQLSALWGRDVKAGRPPARPGEGGGGNLMTPEQILTAQLLAQGYAREDIPALVRKRLAAGLPGMAGGFPAGGRGQPQGPQLGQAVKLPGGLTFRPFAQ